jgi:hypothetical protein
MGNRLDKRVGRGMSRYVKPLVGYWELRDLMEEQRSALATQEALLASLIVELRETRQQLTELLPAETDRVLASLTQETDRLDGYLRYQSETTRAVITRQPEPSGDS